MAWIIAGCAAGLLLFCFWLIPAWRFLEDFRKSITVPVEETRHTLSELHVNNHSVTIDTYETSRNTGTTLIVIPGLHPAGIGDPRFIGFAGCVARAGFRVIAVDVPPFREFQITSGAIDFIEQVILQISASEPNRRIGILGISYGAGPALIAAERPSLRNRIHFLVSVGGYYNLLHAIEFNLTGMHLHSKPRKTHPWGRLIFAYQQLDNLELGKDAEIMRESILLRLHLKESDAEIKEKELTPSGKAFLQELLGSLSPATLHKFHNMIQDHSGSAKFLSPESVIRNLNPELRVYLLHGFEDDSVPYEETEELAKALHHAGIQSIHTHITTLLTHVDTKKSIEMVDQLRLLWWARCFIREAS